MDGEVGNHAYDNVILTFHIPKPSLKNGGPNLDLEENENFNIIWTNFKVKSIFNFFCDI